jgi:hypothetical protein
MDIAREIVFKLTSKFFVYSLKSESHEIVERISTYIKDELEIIGLNVLSEKFSPFNFKAILVYILFGLFSLNTCAEYLTKPHDTLVMLDGLLNISFLIHVMMKCIIFNIYHEHKFKILNMVLEFHKKTAQLSVLHAKKLREWTSNISCTVFFIFLLFTLLGLTDSIVMLLIADHQTLTFIIPLVFFTFALYGHQVILSGIVLFISHMFVQMKSTIISIEQLDELILQNNQGENNGKIEHTLRVIVEAHVDLTNYMNIFNEVYSLIYLVEFLTIIPCIAAFLTQLSVDLTTYANYLGLVLCMFGVFCSCLLGSLLQVQQNKHFNVLCALSWTNLPLEQQKLIKMMLVASMENSCIQCGIWNYNLEMFVSLCSSSYSYLNILLSFKK